MQSLRMGILESNLLQTSGVTMGTTSLQVGGESEHHHSLERYSNKTKVFHFR